MPHTIFQGSSFLLRFIYFVRGTNHRSCHHYFHSYLSGRTLLIRIAELVPKHRKNHPLPPGMYGAAAAAAAAAASSDSSPAVGGSASSGKGNNKKKKGK